MNSFLASTILALAASSPASAFQPSGRAPRPSLALGSNLRDMASFADDQSRMGVSDPESFSRRSFREGMAGGADGPGGMYAQDGFDPYQGYGGGFGMGGPDRRMGGMPGGGMDQYAGGMMMDGAKATDTMGGFAYSSRSTDYGYGPPEYFEGPMMGGGFEGPMMGGGYDRGFEGPPMGGMDWEPEYGPGPGYGGFGGEMGRLGP